MRRENLEQRATWTVLKAVLKRRGIFFILKNFLEVQMKNRR